MSTIDTDQINKLGLGFQPEKKKKELGQEDFLRLMSAQLQNQDPMKPMENGDFLSQIAQFGTVNGIEGLQKSFESLSGSLYSNQALQASALVGREVLVPGKIGLLKATGNLAGVVELPASANAVTLQIKDQAGQLVRSVDLGAQKAGTISFAWDGTNDKGDMAVPGLYSIEATTSVNGKQQALVTAQYAGVESVSVGKGKEGLTLNLAGLGSMEFTKIQEIR